MSLSPDPKRWTNAELREEYDAVLARLSEVCEPADARLLVLGLQPVLDEMLARGMLCRHLEVCCRRSATR